MNEIRTLLRHSTHYLGGRVCLIIVSFISFPLFTRLFSVADYGKMSLVLKIIAAAGVLAKLGIQYSVTRFYEEEKASPNKDALRRFNSTLFLGNSFGAGVVALLFALGVWALPASAISSTLRNFLLLASILILIRGTQTVLAGFLPVEGRTKAYNVLDIVSKAAVSPWCSSFILSGRAAYSHSSQDLSPPKRWLSLVWSRHCCDAAC
jgi:O-antigen/teichoic acid export membrane protein